MADPSDRPDSKSFDPSPMAMPEAPSLDSAEIETLVRRYRVPPDEAERILDEVTLSLLAKRGRIRDPRRWLRRALRRRCVDWWRRRRRLLARVLDDGLIRLLEDDGLAEGERGFLSRELERHLAPLRPECRRLLARRYGLDVEDDGGEGDAVRSQPENERACLEALVRRVGKA